MSLSTHVHSALSIAVTALGLAAAGIVAYRYTSKSPRTSGRDEDFTPAERWKDGPWAIGKRGMKAPPRVSELWVYPIKSCKAIKVDTLTYGPRGVEYDREWCLLDAKTHKVLTQRDLPRMVFVHPEIVRDHLEEPSGVLRVSFPSDSGCETFETPLAPSAETLAEWEYIDEGPHFEWPEIDVHVCPALAPHPGAAAAELSRFLGRRVLLARKGPGARSVLPTALYPALDARMVFQDECPLHVCSRESATAVQALMREMAGRPGIDEAWREQELDMKRLRANVVLEGAGSPFVEDAWDEIVFRREEDSPSADAPISCICRTARCQIPNFDQDTGVLDPSLLKVLLQRRNHVALEKNSRAKGCLGINCVPKGTGVIHVGDRVEVNRWMQV